jgi:two-component system, NarL family, nitrate/nitrite response regulator NarL
VIDVVVVAPVRAYREAVGCVLDSEPGIRLRGTGATSADAVTQGTVLRPSVLLLDLAMPDCFAAARTLRRIGPEIRLIGIGSCSDADTVAAAGEGIDGFVDADQPLADLIAGIELAVAGGAPCSPRIAAVLMRALRHGPTVPLAPPVGGSALTSREYQIADLVSRGLTNREVANRLFLGEATVKSHLRAVLRKLGVAGRQEIAAALVRPGRP